MQMLPSANLKADSCVLFAAMHATGLEVQVQASAEAWHCTPAEAYIACQLGFIGLLSVLTHKMPELALMLLCDTQRQP